MSNLRENTDGLVRQLVRQPVRLFNMIHADLMRLAGGTAAPPAAPKQDAPKNRVRSRIRNSLRRNAGKTVDLATPANRSFDGVTLDNVRGAAAPEDECIYAIGDIHGQDIVFERLLAKIEADASDLPEDVTPVLVFLGDYIDRGLGSRKVVDLLVGDRLARFSTVFIAGNHEDALLRFLADPEIGREWLMYGGRETLVSYGVKPPSPRTASEEDWIDAWEAFRDALPETHLRFFNALEHSHTRGDYVFVHAGLRPGVPLWKQSNHDMMWIRDPFLKSSDAFPKMVVHGHTPSATPEIDHRRLGLDTGAYSTGVLTAARLSGLDISILST